MALATKTKRKPPAHYKKRQAAHHHKSKQYVKSYWPYLPMLLFIAGGLLLSNLLSSQSHVLGVQSSYAPQTLLNDTNIQRQANHESGLTISDQLTNAAQAKAADMVQKDYWAHVSPSGKTPWDFMAAAGYNYVEAGENLAYGFSSAGQVMNGWMNSPDHRANILDASYTNVGFGVASSPNFQGKGPETVVVAEYGEPTGAAANISFTVPPPTGTITNAQPTEPSSQSVSRLALVGDKQPSWSLVAIVLIASSALTFFVVNHALRLRRALVKGETFLTHHPAFDMIIVFVFMVGFVLTRASGVIR
jgi:uncharacterized protein YkwD